MPITGSLTPIGELNGTISDKNFYLEGFIEKGSGSVPTYDGSYEVTPLPEAEVVLETSGKRLTDDVTVLEIPYFETTNESGGYTVIIG